MANLRCSTDGPDQFFIASVCRGADDGVLGVVFRNNLKLRRTGTIRSVYKGREVELYDSYKQPSL